MPRLRSSLTDTTGIFHGSPTLLANPATSTTISITGFGSGHFTQAVDAGLDLLDNAAGFASLLDPTNVLLAQNTVFAAWNLATTFGPLEQVGSAFAANGSFSTSLGTLVVTGAQNVSFGAVVTAVPEPATWRTNTLVSTATMASHHFPAYGGTHPCKRLRLAL